MAFDDLVRMGVGLANNLTSSLQPTVTVSRWSSQDIRGNATYAAPFTLTGVFTEKAEIIEREGRFIQVVGSLLIMERVGNLAVPNRSNPFDTKDLFQLPGGKTGYPVLVEGPADPDGGSFVTKVWFGKKTV